MSCQRAGLNYLARTLDCMVESCDVGSGRQRVEEIKEKPEYAAVTGTL